MPRQFQLIAAALLFFTPTFAQAQETEADPADAVTDGASPDVAEIPEALESEEENLTANCELGGTLTAGNSRSGLLTTGCAAAQLWERFKLSSGGGVNFGRTKYGGIGTDATGNKILEGDWKKTQLSMFLQLREDYFLTPDKRSYVYMLQSISQDKFAGYKMRFVAELGAGRVYAKTESQEHAAEIGFQYERERAMVTNANEHRVGMVASVLGKTVFSDNALFEYVVTYLPSFQDSDDWRLNSNGSLNFKIAERLSFKSGISVLYDHEPSSIVPVDENGVVVVDANGDPVASVPARNTDIIWNNVLVLSIF